MWCVFMVLHRHAANAAATAQHLFCRVRNSTPLSTIAAAFAVDIAQNVWPDVPCMQPDSMHQMSVLISPLCWQWVDLLLTSIPFCICRSHRRLVSVRIHFAELFLQVRACCTVLTIRILLSVPLQILPGLDKLTSKC